MYFTLSSCPCYYYTTIHRVVCSVLYCRIGSRAYYRGGSHESHRTRTRIAICGYIKTIAHYKSVLYCSVLYCILWWNILYPIVARRQNCVISGLLTVSVADVCELPSEHLGGDGVGCHEGDPANKGCAWNIYSISLSLYIYICLIQV